MKMRALLSTVLLLLVVGNAFGQATPLDYEYYAKFPNHGDSSMAPPLEAAGVPPGTHMGLQRFYEMLRRMRNARDELRTYCIGPKWQDMIRTVRGAKVLIWPERFADCERDADLLDKGNPMYTMPLANWNKIYGTTYPLPRGEAADVQAWSHRKGEFLHFVDSACNEASRAMVLAGDPGFSEPPTQVFERAKKRCPAKWVGLFEPEEAIKKRENAAKRVCRRGTTYMVATTTGPDKPYETCDEDDRYVPPESDKKSPADKRANALADELAAIQRGEFERPAGTGEFASSTQAMLNARRQAGAGLTAAMENGVRQQAKAGSIGGMQIFGGENGQLLEMALNSQAFGNLDAAATSGAAPPSSKECDMGAEEAYFAQQIKALESRISSMSIEQQQCAQARAYAQGLRRLVAAQQRCGQSNNAAQNQAALNNVQNQEQALCNGKAQGRAPSRPAQTAAPYQAPRSAPPPSKSPTTPCCSGGNRNPAS